MTCPAQRSPLWNRFRFVRTPFLVLSPSELSHREYQRDWENFHVHFFNRKDVRTQQLRSQISLQRTHFGTVQPNYLNYLAEGYIKYTEFIFSTTRTKNTPQEPIKSTDNELTIFNVARNDAKQKTATSNLVSV